MLGGWIRNTAIVYEPKELKSDIVNAMDHNCSFHALQEHEDQQTNLRFYSSAQLWTTTHSKITNSFHFWFKQKSCLCINWTQTDNASSFVMQVLLWISGGICCVTQCGVEPFKLWPPFFLFSQHAWQFSRVHWLVCTSEPCSQLAVPSMRCICCARWLDCVKPNAKA